MGLCFIFSYCHGAAVSICNMQWGFQVSTALQTLFVPAGLQEAGRMRSGETVLVTAAAGGVGQFVVQLAKQAGNTVIATCGSEDKARLLRRLGADRIINYRKESLKEVLKKEYPKVSSFRQSLQLSCPGADPDSISGGLCHAESEQVSLQCFISADRSSSSYVHDAPLLDVAWLW